MKLLYSLCALLTLTSAFAREPATPPSPVTLTDFKLVGNFTNDHAAFTLTATATVERGKAASLDLLEGTLALTDLGPHPGWDLRAEPNRFVLVFPRAGKFPIRLKFDAAVRQSPDGPRGWRRVDFHVAPAALQQVVLQGLPAETQFDFAGAARPQRTGGGFVSYLPADGAVKLSWKEARPEAEGKLFYAAEMLSQISVSPGLMRQVALLDFKIMQGELTKVTLAVRGAGEVTRVQGDQVLAWNVQPQPGSSNRLLVVQFNQPQNDHFAIQVNLQTPLGAFPQSADAVQLQPEGATRFAGAFRVVNEGAVRLEVAQASGLSQLSPEQFPENDATRAALRPTGGQRFVYRFSGPEFALRIQADQILPELGVSQVTAYRLGESELAIDSELELDIREAPLRELLLRVPKGYALARLSASGLADYFLREPPDGGDAELRLVYGQPVSGRQVIDLRLEHNQALGETNWTLPRLEVAQAKSMRGNVAVAADAGFRLSPERTQGLTEVATAFFPAKVAGIQSAFRLSDPAWQAVLRVERLPQTIQADVFHLFSIGEGIAYGSSLINYSISGAPVSTFKVELSDEFFNVEFTGKDLRNWQKTDGGYLVQLHTPVSGSYTLLATYERPFKAQGATLAFNGARPLDAQSEQGHIVIISGYQFEKKPAEVSPGLLALEAGEVPPEYRLFFDAPILAAYRYASRPFQLKLALSPLAQGDSQSQIVDRATLATRVSKEGQVLTDVRYFVKNRGHPNFRITLPPGAALWSATVNGASVAPVMDGDANLIPLPQRSDPDAVLAVELQLAAKSSNPKNVSVSTPIVGVPVMLEEWKLEPDTGQRLMYRGGSLTPIEGVPDASGFAALMRTFTGDDAGRAIILLLGALGLFAAALVVWHWSVRAGVYRFTARHLSGTVLGLVALVIGVLALLQLAAIFQNNRTEIPRTLSFLAPVQQERSALTIQFSNLSEKAFPRELTGSIILVALGLVAWIWAWIRSAPKPKYGAVLLGWLLLAWAALRAQGGTDVFVGLLGVFLLVHAIIPALRRLWQVPRQPESAPAGKAGGAAPAVAAWLLIGFVCVSNSRAVAQASKPSPPCGQLFCCSDSVSPTSQSAKAASTRRASPPPTFAGLETCETADLEVCATCIQHPEGMTENSPGFQPWVSGPSVPSPEGTADTSDFSGPNSTPDFSRPSGTYSFGRPHPTLKRWANLDCPSGTKRACRLKCSPSIKTKIEPNADCTPAPLPVAESVTQDLRIEESFALATAKIRWQAIKGQRLPLLFSPAVLTHVDYPKAGLKLVEQSPLPATPTDGPRSAEAAAEYFVAEKSGLYDISLQYQMQISKRDSQSGVVLPAPYGLINRVSLTLVNLDVEVLSPQAVSISRDSAGSNTVASLVMTPVNAAWIAWKPRSRDVKHENPVFYAELAQLFVPAAGVIEGTHYVSLRPAQGELDHLVLDVPQGAAITDVSDPASSSKLVSAWRFDPDSRKLRITLNPPQSRPFTVLVRSQIPTGPLPVEKTAGLLTVENAAGQIGLLGIATGNEVQLDSVKAEGFSAMNLEDFPVDALSALRDQLPGLTVRRAFRYSVAGAAEKEGLAFSLRASAVEPDVRVEAQNTLSLGEDRTILAADLAVAITRAGIFKLSFVMPVGFDVESISGPALSHWTEVKSEAGRVITLHLSGKTEGDQKFTISLTGPGVKSARSWEVPDLLVREASKQRGTLLLVPEQGMRLQVAARDGVTQLDPQKAGIRQPGVLAFRLLQTPWKLALDIEQVEPWIQVTSLQHALVNEAQVKVVANLQYQIENTGLKVLRVLVPTNAEGVRFQGEQVALAVPGEATNGLQAWDVKLHRRVIGPYFLQATYQIVMPEGAAATSLRGVQAADVNLQRGFVTMQAGGRLQVRSESVPDALQPAEWQSIPHNLERDLPAVAANFTYRLVEPSFELPLTLERHEAAKLLPARIEHVAFSSVVSDAGIMLTRVTLDLLPGDERELDFTLPPDARFWFAFVNHNGVWPWRKGDSILVPLDQPQRNGRTLPVELFYSCRAGATSPRSLQLELAAPRFALPLEDLTWRVAFSEKWQPKRWSGALQLQQDEIVPRSGDADLQKYLENEAALQQERTKEAEGLLAAANSALEQGNPQQARRAFQAAYGLSAGDAAFNEDARVQLHNVKLQQALIGLNVRQAALAGAAGGLEAKLHDLRGRNEINYTQQDAKDIIERNDAEDNAAFMRLAERIIQQQDAAVSSPGAIRATVPEQGRVLTFKRAVVVESWADLKIHLAASAAATASWTGRAAALVCTTLFLFAFAWAGLIFRRSA